MNTENKQTDTVDVLVIFQSNLFFGEVFRHIQDSPFRSVYFCYTCAPDPITLSNDEHPINGDANVYNCMIMEKPGLVTLQDTDANKRNANFPRAQIANIPNKLCPYWRHFPVVFPLPSCECPEV